MEALKISQEFRSIIPPLSKEEFEGLEKNILDEGKVRDPIVVWNGTIIDGHNRYELANKHGIGYETVEKCFEDELAAKLWIIDNQLGRRNVQPFVRIELAMIREPIIKTLAKAKQVRKPIDSVPQVTAEQNRSQNEARNQLADIANVSHDTLTRALKIKEIAPPEIIQELREGKRSIHETERELRVGSKVCEFCGEEKPLSRFQNEGGAKCLDCKKKKNTIPYADITSGEKRTSANPSLIEGIEATTSVNGLDLEVEDEVKTDDEYEEIPVAPIESSQKLSSVEMALGASGKKAYENSPEYKAELRQIGESVKKMDEYSRNHKKTIEEFQQMFRANTEMMIESLGYQLRSMDSELWLDETNKTIASDLIDEAVEAVKKLKEEFLA